MKSGDNFQALLGCGCLASGRRRLWIVGVFRGFEVQGFGGLRVQRFRVQGFGGLVRVQGFRVQSFLGFRVLGFSLSRSFKVQFKGLVSLVPWRRGSGAFREVGLHVLWQR